MKKIYIDSNVFISYWNMEYGRNIHDYLEYFSEQLFERSIKCEFYILISDLVLDELDRFIKPPRTSALSLLKPFEELDKLKILQKSDGAWTRAKEICKTYGTHLADALHAAFAEEERATLVTWNVKDFIDIEFIEVRTPQDL
jgi:predicted nucleic acid-binding protein